MKKKKKIIFIVLISIIASENGSHAQSYSKKENNIWLGGDGYPNGYPIGMSMDFNSNPPQSDQSCWSPLFSGGSPSGASVSDKNGDLLFYTEGNVVWNRNHQVMPNGFNLNNSDPLYNNDTIAYISYLGGLPNSAGSYDGVVIIPMPGNSHKYYIFSIETAIKTDTLIIYPNILQYTIWTGILRYTVVNMELNNGLGAVDSDQRGIVIDNNQAGALQGVVGDNCNYWLLSYNINGSYNAFNITAAGIDTTPVVSTVAPLLANWSGELNVSPNRRKVVQAFEGYAEVSDFNPATGVLSNPVALNNDGACTSASFSADNSKIYLGDIYGIKQFDLSTIPPWAYAFLSINNVTGFEYDSPLRLGPDNKIYFQYNGIGRCIQQANLFGSACQIDTLVNMPSLLSSRSLIYFPNEIPILDYDTISITNNIPLCFDAANVPLQPDSLGTDYHWLVDNTIGTNYYQVGNDTTKVLIAYVPGIYTVNYFTANPCVFHQDTFIVNRVTYSFSLGKDRISCDGQPVILKATLKDAQYLWSDNSTNAEYVADTSGVYWVQTTQYGCIASDSVHVKITDVRQDLGKDTLLCIEDGTAAITLYALTSPEASILWSTGSMQPSITVADSGLYWVQITDGTCTGKDSILINKEWCDCAVLIPTAFSPNNDGKNDEFFPAIPPNCEVTVYKLVIYNRWGQMIWVSDHPNERWNGFYNGKEADIGTYMYSLQMKVGTRHNAVLQKGDFVLIR